MITATRYHDISCGHRVVGHTGKCRHLHGHNYRIHFSVVADELDAQGMVVDFGVIKDTLSTWLEGSWDHKMILWDKDPLVARLQKIDLKYEDSIIFDSIELVPFNPTAENIAQFLLNVIGPLLLPPNVKLIKVVVEETRKCSAAAEL